MNDPDRPRPSTDMPIILLMGGISLGLAYMGAAFAVFILAYAEQMRWTASRHALLLSALGGFPVAALFSAGVCAWLAIRLWIGGVGHLTQRRVLLILCPPSAALLYEVVMLSVL